MESFYQLYDRLDQTMATSEKVAALVSYYASAPLQDRIWTTLLLRAKIRRHPLTSKRLRDSFLRLSHIPAWLLSECHAHVGDSAETVALLMQSQMLQIPRLQIQDRSLNELMTVDLKQLRTDSDENLDQRLLKLWGTTKPEHWFLINKLLTGAFRVGVSERLVIKALAQATQQSESSWYQWLMGKTDENFAELEAIFKGEVSAAQTLKVTPFCLAAPVESAFFETESPADFSAEWKWDGIRAQIIKSGDDVWIWSRGEDMITDAFPEIKSMVQSWPQDVVLDGELLAWDQDHPLDFHMLQKRLGRKKITPSILKDSPVIFMAYDLLYLNDTDWTAKPLAARRATLKEFASLHRSQKFYLSEQIPFETWEELKLKQLEARDRGAEGLMLKNLESPYVSGRKRGVWWKFKLEPYTLDAVLLYAQAGSGKRANLFTDYTFALWSQDQLVTFAKAYSGLDNQEIEELDRWIRRHTKEKFGPVRSLQVHHVFEIAFEGIGPSPRHKSGIAVRFPRIKRWRRDKKPEDANHLEDAWKLIAPPV